MAPEPVYGLGGGLGIRKSDRVSAAAASPAALYTSRNTLQTFPLAAAQCIWYVWVLLFIPRTLSMTKMCYFPAARSRRSEDF